MMKVRFQHDTLAKHGVTLEEAEQCFSEAAHQADWEHLLDDAKNGSGTIATDLAIEEYKPYFVFHAMSAPTYEQRQYRSRGK